MEKSAAKRKNISPTKGTDHCAACNEGLDENSCALQCDNCDNWLCIECLDMPKPEYVLFTKMTRRVACIWVCTVCKNTDPNAVFLGAKNTTTLDQIQGIITTSMKTASEKITDDQLSQLQVTIKKVVCDSFAEYGKTVADDIAARIQVISDKMSNLESEVASKCTLQEVKGEIDNLVSKRVAEMTVDIKEEVRKEMVRERDRQQRRLNIVAYGVVPQTNDAQFIKAHLETDYGMPDVEISGVKRLGTAKGNPHNSEKDRPVPVLFTVKDMTTKRSILQKSFELKADIQFRGDASKEERLERKELVSELRERTAKGEKDLVIQRGRIVSKNLQTAGGSPARSGTEAMNF